MHRTDIERFCSKPLEERLALSDSIKARHPGTVPIILDTSRFKGELSPEHRWKYICPETHLLSHLYWEVIRNGLQISFQESIHFFIYDGFLYATPLMSSTLLEIYNKYRDKDGFLYLHICKENTFG